MKATLEDLQDALKQGAWVLRKNTMFFLNRREDDELSPPHVVLKVRTTVFVRKVSRKHRAALLCYIDRTGKVWWSWVHASVMDKPVPGDHFDWNEWRQSQEKIDPPN